MKTTQFATLAVSRPKLERLMEAALDERARYLGRGTSCLFAPLRGLLLRWSGIGAAACLGLAVLATKG